MAFRSNRRCFAPQKTVRAVPFEMGQRRDTIAGADSLRPLIILIIAQFLLGCKGQAVTFYRLFTVFLAVPEP